ncbi:MAG: hypothetical protein C0608_08545 [Deltaproteobacteria bacterium]|nr:MAG: hypothetical protein C0608_08545 [Deltaproteobacteria bacterium]
MYENLRRFEQILFDLCSLILVGFYSYSAVGEPAATQYHRGIYILVTYVLVFLTYRTKMKFGRVIDYLLIVLSTITIIYWIANFEDINYRMGAETDIDMAMAVVGVLLGIELARRVVGNIFVFIGVLLLLYGVYGEYMPELISHAGDTFPSLCVSIFYRSDGVFGIMANVLATYILLFVIFGAFLEKCGAQKFFIDFPLAAVGHKVGGPAKVAVIASGLFGSISGSAIANTVSTGTFTIPMMKRAGFRPHVAGAIEPAASIGGMFMPPIMGAGGFIMAEMTGMPYSWIMLVSLFPALMYFFSVFVMVHYEAKIHGVVGEKHEVSALEIVKQEWFYILPLLSITVLMLFNYSPAYSAVIGIGTCIVVSWFRKDTRMGALELLEAAREGTENSLKIGATVGVIGIIIGVLTYSGVVLTFADIVIELAHGSLFMTILLIALASLVLGMGVPVTAAYLITAVVAVPALTHLGVNEIAAHMIVYWLSQDSNITPPVCIAAFAGATIAQANMWKTAFTSFKFAKFLYLAPFLFGYVPAFSLDGTPGDIAKVFFVIILGTYFYAYLLSGVWLHQIKERAFKEMWLPVATLAIVLVFVGYSYSVKSAAKTILTDSIATVDASIEDFYGKKPTTTYKEIRVSTFSKFPMMVRDIEVKLGTRKLFGAKSLTFDEAEDGTGFLVNGEEVRIREAALGEWGEGLGLEDLPYAKLNFDGFYDTSGGEGTFVIRDFTITGDGFADFAGTIALTNFSPALPFVKGVRDASLTELEFTADGSGYLKRLLRQIARGRDQKRSEMLAEGKAAVEEKIAATSGEEADSLRALISFFDAVDNLTVKFNFSGPVPVDRFIEEIKEPGSLLDKYEISFAHEGE